MRNVERPAAKKKAVRFWCEGDALAGTLYLPPGVPVGAVVLTGPITSVKEQAVANYAHAMTQRGWLALVFDHRGFGESQGGPYQLESPCRKIADVRAAISYVQSLPPTPHGVHLIGICAGGGYMAQAAAEDDRISGLACVVGFFHDVTALREVLGEDFDRQIRSAQAAREAYEATGELALIPAVAPEGGNVALPLRAAYDYYASARGAAPNYRNGFAVQSCEHTLPFDAQSAADKIKVPTMIIHSETALSPTLARKFFDRLMVTKEDLWLPSAGQIDFYDDERLIERSADAIDTFFRRMQTEERAKPQSQRVARGPRKAEELHTWTRKVVPAKRKSGPTRVPLQTAAVAAAIGGLLWLNSDISLDRFLLSGGAKMSQQVSAEAKARTKAAPVPAPSQSAAMAPAAVAAAPAQPKASGAVIQVGAYSSQGAAMAAWAELKQQFPIAERTSPDFIPVNSSGKRLYRLRASGGEAAELCASMKSDGASCIVIAKEVAGRPDLRNST